MFAELTPLLKPGDTLAITVGVEGDGRFRVNVHPQLFTLAGRTSEESKSLNQPVSIVGTAAELDAGLAGELTRFTTSVQMLRHTIDEVEATHKTAAEAKKTKTPAAKTGEKPAKAKTDKEEPDAEEDDQESLLGGG